MKKHDVKEKKNKNKMITTRPEFRWGLASQENNVSASRTEKADGSLAKFWILSIDSFSVPTVIPRILLGGVYK